MEGRNLYILTSLYNYHYFLGCHKGSAQNIQEKRMPCCVVLKYSSRCAVVNTEIENVVILRGS